MARRRKQSGRGSWRSERPGNISNTASSSAPLIHDQPPIKRRVGWCAAETIDCLAPWRGDDAQKGKR